MQSDDDNQSPSKNALAPTDPLQVEAKSITDSKVHSSTTRSYSKSAHPTKCAHLTRTLCRMRVQLLQVGQRKRKPDLPCTIFVMHKTIEESVKSVLTKACHRAT